MYFIIILYYQYSLLFVTITIHSFACSPPVPNTLVSIPKRVSLSLAPNMFAFKIKSVSSLALCMLSSLALNKLFHLQHQTRSSLALNKFVHLQYQKSSF